MRWKAIQDAAFIDPADGKEKIWSESNVSEDFDMALRLLQRGYIIRCAFTSIPIAWNTIMLMVILTFCDDAGGQRTRREASKKVCRLVWMMSLIDGRSMLMGVMSEFRLLCVRDFTTLLNLVSSRLLFNPLVQWWRRGPISAQIHKFIWSKAPIHYKISMLSCTLSFIYSARLLLYN